MYIASFSFIQLNIMLVDNWVNQTLSIYNGDLQVYPILHVKRKWRTKTKLVAKKWRSWERLKKSLG